MNILKCPKGHYYDSETNTTCPHCNANTPVWSSNDAFFSTPGSAQSQPVSAPYAVPSRIEPPVRAFNRPRDLDFDDPAMNDVYASPEMMGILSYERPNATPQPLQPEPEPMNCVYAAPEMMRDPSYHVKPKKKLFQKKEKAPVQTAPAFCRACGTKLSGDWMFCPTCGSKR